MDLHFIFLIKEEERNSRTEEFQYIQSMAAFFGVWIRKEFGVSYDVQCDMMLASRRSLLQRPDTHVLLQDHRRRGAETYRFYLTYFRPLWTDCTCEGYHAENFGMAWWRHKEPFDLPFVARNNCTAVSHEIAHELLRQRGYKKYIPDVHDIWTKHLFADLPFWGYDVNGNRVRESPTFLTMDTTDLGLKT